MNAQTLIDTATALPTTERITIVESLLQSLNPPNSSIDNAWLKTANKRLTELQSGKVTALDGKQVLVDARTKLQQ